MVVMKLAEGGIFQLGTATNLLVEGICIHCQEEMGPLEECIKFSCEHTFHNICAFNWCQHQAQNNPPVQHRGISGGDVKKLTCPLCRANVVT
jgi:hypothetical protein